MPDPQITWDDHPAVQWDDAPQSVPTGMNAVRREATDTSLPQFTGPTSKSQAVGQGLEDVVSPANVLRGMGEAGTALADRFDQIRTGTAPQSTPFAQVPGHMLQSFKNAIVPPEGTPFRGYVAGGRFVGMVAPLLAGGVPENATPAEPMTPEVAARNLTRAVLPSAQEWPSYMNATSKEAGNIIDYARRTGTPIDSQLDWAKAARGAAEEAKNHYQQNILGPHADESVSVAGTGYQGKSSFPNNDATLGDINARIGQINNELRPGYVKNESGKVMTAAANEAQLTAERNALTEKLHQQLAARTGLQPDDIAGLRQRFGRMYSIADQTEAAVNQRQLSVGKGLEGRNEIPTTATQALINWIKAARGGPEGVAQRGYQSALPGLQNIPASQLPQPSVGIHGIEGPEAAGWQLHPGTPTEFSVGGSTPEEISAQQSRLDQRAQSVKQALSDAAQRKQVNLMRRPQWNQ